jgi:hypothetical protein
MIVGLPKDSQGRAGGSRRVHLSKRPQRFAHYERPEPSLCRRSPSRGKRILVLHRMREEQGGEHPG